MKIAITLAIAAGFVLGACSSSTTQSVKVEEPEFVVKEAAQGGREAWLDNPYLYAKEKDLDVKENYYYSAEAHGADKRLTCEKAQANLTDDISKHVVTFVDSSIARAKSESQAADSEKGTTETGQVAEETQSISSQLSKTMVSNVHILRTYWEKRDYSKAGGARSIYYCWVLGEIGKKQVGELVRRAQTVRLKENGELKSKVEKKLGDLSDDYEKYQEKH